MANLRLESDHDQSVVGHLEEFAARVSVVLLVLVTLTALFSQRVDDVLIEWLDALAPCSDCMVVFEPGAWIGLRWTAAILLAALLTLPLVVQQAVAFASPGLLPGERRRLALGLTFASTVGVGVGVVSGGIAAPYVYTSAMRTVESTGLVLALDAVTLVQLTLALMWILALLGAATGVALGAGLVGRLDRERVVTWRWRVSLPLVLLIVGSTWATTNELRWPLAVFAALVLEVPLLPWRRMEPRTLPTVLDHEGRRRRVLVVDCAHRGGAHSTVSWNDTLYRLTTSAGLVDHQRERTALIERMQDGMATDVILLGCTEDALPARFIEAVASTGARLRFMDQQDHEEDHAPMTTRSLAQRLDLYVTNILGP